MKNKGRIMRIAAAAAALAMTAAYFLLPVSDSRNRFTNSGRKKMTLTPGEACQWTWTPELEGTNELEILLSGIHNAQGITVSAELLDGDKPAASAKQNTGEMTEGKEVLLLKGSFEQGKTYTLVLRTEGEGTLKVKGAPDEETGEFRPMLNEIARTRIHNPTLLYFAAGALLAVATPVTGEGEVRTRRRRRREGTSLEKALPAATLALIAFFGIYLAAARPLFDAGAGWTTWDEDSHWAAVQGMSLFQEGGLRSLAAKTATWNPGYLPLAAAFNLGKIFTSDLAMLYRLSVGFNALVYA